MLLYRIVNDVCTALYRKYQPLAGMMIGEIVFPKFINIGIANIKDLQFLIQDICLFVYKAGCIIKWLNKCMVCIQRFYASFKFAVDLFLFFHAINKHSSTSNTENKCIYLPTVSPILTEAGSKINSTLCLPAGMARPLKA